MFITLEKIILSDERGRVTGSGPVIYKDQWYSTNKFPK